MSANASSIPAGHRQSVVLSKNQYNGSREVDLGEIKHHEVDTPWVMNDIVNKIPYTKWNQNFDGLCTGIALKSTTSWSQSKTLHKVSLTIIEKISCEHRLLRNCDLYYCTKYDVMKLTSTAAEGGGLVCHGTEDPLEDPHLGVLVGVTSLINIGLPSLHNRIGLYYQWVTDNQTHAKLSSYVVLTYILVFF
ncbi:hypothetical protein KGM_212252 [Danaus plexippus plexippus]|uniref:Peptidase S1 domain-containing protein n=1 Tax=Danaus plexippus plexippus TaxID=278856 RepID=A0A212EH65_DANPL|nr:hypothetical protein KGM_212252 [Danaus plexippus plexippus]